MRTAVLFAVVAIGMLGYPLLVFLYRPLGQDNPLWYVLVYGVFGRIFFRPALNAYYAFEIFPQHHPFTWFADVSTWAQLRGIEFINISTVVSGYRVDAQGAAPPPSIGTFYAELGWPGVVLGALFAAALFKAVENIFFNARRIDAIHLALYSVLVYGAFRFNWGYFHPIVKTECILPTLVALAAWNLWRRLDWSLPYPARGGAEAR
jgi:hypothetical protein